MHVVRGSEVSPGIEATRTQVIGAMMAGRTFMVATQGEAQVAAPIYLVHAEGSLVLRTDRDEEPQDWLEGASEI
jgi:hypothetical protein